METTDNMKPGSFSGAVVSQIRAERAARGWSMEDLAERSGIAVVSLSRYVNGKRDLTMGTVDKIAAAFGIELGEFLRRAVERQG